MGSGIDKRELVELFRHEAVKYLELLNDGLTELQRGASSSLLLERLLRVAHTLNGSAGLVGFSAVSTAAHRREELLSGVQQGFMDAGGCAPMLFRGLDLIEGLLNGEMGDDAGKIDAFARLVTAHLSGKTKWTTPTSRQVHRQITTAFQSPDGGELPTGGGRPEGVENRYTRVATEELDQMQGLTA